LEVTFIFGTMKSVYFIKETNGKWNFAIVAVVGGKKNITLTSVGQSYSRHIDCIQTFRNNCFKLPEVEVTRSAFNAWVRKK
jgi:hypothetical protein